MSRLYIFILNWILKKSSAYRISVTKIFISLLYFIMIMITNYGKILNKGMRNKIKILN